MGKLELNPPLLLITMGYPGAGKTFFARQFAEQYELARLSEERFRYELFEKPQFNQDESDIISRILDYSLEQLMKTGESIICDGTFSRFARRRELIELARANGYRTLTIWLQTDATTSQTRAGKRDRRGQDSKYSFDILRATFEQLASQLERPGEKEASVVISGKHAFKGQSLTVLRKITDVYASAAANLPAGHISRHQTRPVNGQPKRSRFIQ